MQRNDGYEETSFYSRGSVVGSLRMFLYFIFHALVFVVDADNLA